MSLYLDQKYIAIISSRLERFIKKNPSLYNFRCPFCGDSKKKKTKLRGYFYARKTNMFFRCHNCGRSEFFSNTLKDLDGNLYKQYILEKFTDKHSPHQTEDPDFNIVTQSQKNQEIRLKENQIGIPSIEDLESGHYARVYVEKRLIPNEFFKKLYFSEDFNKFVDSLIPSKYKLEENDPRLVIPFFNVYGELIAVQGRALNYSSLRYITIKIKDEPKIFGMDRIDLTKPVYVVEGPIDSLFLPNCIAAAGSDISFRDLPTGELIFVYDNESRNPEIVARMEKVIRNSYNICIWPNTIREKDINDMILSGKTPEDIENIIKKNTYFGLAAKLQLVKWRNC